MERVKVTITAEDRIGREESITFYFDELTAKRLEKAANTTYSTTPTDAFLVEELNDLLDRYGYGSSLSRSQYRRLDDFFDLIYHKFYNYMLSIKIWDKNKN